LRDCQKPVDRILPVCYYAFADGGKGLLGKGDLMRTDLTRDGSRVWEDGFEDSLPEYGSEWNYGDEVVVQRPNAGGGLDNITGYVCGCNSDGTVSVCHGGRTTAFPASQVYPLEGLYE